MWPGMRKGMGEWCKPWGEATQKQTHTLTFISGRRIREKFMETLFIRAGAKFSHHVCYCALQNSWQGLSGYVLYDMIKVHELGTRGES